MPRIHPSVTANTLDLQIINGFTILFNDRAFRAVLLGLLEIYRQQLSNGDVMKEMVVMGIAAPWLESSLFRTIRHTACLFTSQLSLLLKYTALR